MAPPQSRREACHNCRRRRLKCDRSFPQCVKCIKRGQECLGYQRLFRWEPGVSSRGKMAGMTFDQVTNGRMKHKDSSPHLLSTTGNANRRVPQRHIEVSLLKSLTDPLVQDVDYFLRKYLFYFASDVCKDLVLYDIPKHNPFRELIPLTPRYPVLLQIIIASAALHMSNAWQKSMVLDTTDSDLHHQSGPLGIQHSSSLAKKPESYKDALAAKQRALRLLRSALTDLTSVDVDVTLAVVLLFVEFELIDSGRDNWRHHISGARAIIEKVCGPNISRQTAMSPLRRCLISNCMVFDILGSTLASSNDPVQDDPFSTGVISLLHDEEGNHCSSFPVALLQLIRAGTQLSQYDHSSSDLSLIDLKQHALRLLNAAQSFDPLVWATNIQSRSPATDIVLRTHVGTAHRAAVCIYLSRVASSLDPTIELPQDLGLLVADIVTHCSLIHPSNPLFTATTWPAFIAGAETTDPATQEWVTRRFQELWAVEPWGTIRGALGVLERIWAGRRSQAVNGAGSQLKAENGNGDWIEDLKSRGVDWLIL